MKTASILMIFIAISLFAHCQQTSESTLNDQVEVAVTIYNTNLALVKDVRIIKIPKGELRLRFMDVAAQIKPETVHIKSLISPMSLAILEQNYEYDLISPRKLMDKFVGRELELYRYFPMDGKEKWDKAVLMSNNEGPVYKIGDKIWIGHPGNVILPDLPADLIAKPTLVWFLDNALGKDQKVEASYLTQGMSWKCDYVAVLDQKDARMGFNGWVTLNNTSGTSYKNAKLKLVAGDVNVVQAPQPRSYMAMEAAKARVQEFKEEAFFEYHLYTLDRKTNVKNNETKQISLLSADEVPVKKELIYYGASQYYRNQWGEPISNQKVGVYIEIANTKDNNLGMPLPKGTVRVYKADKEGALQFIGEDNIDHTPKDEKIRIKMGEAFDVVGSRKQMDYKIIGHYPYIVEVEWEISLRNHKEEATMVSIIEPIPGDWEILHSTHKWEKIEAHTLKFEVPIAANTEVKVKYRTRITF